MYSHNEKAWFRLQLVFCLQHVHFTILLSVLLYLLKQANKDHLILSYISPYLFLIPIIRPNFMTPESLKDRESSDCEPIVMASGLEVHATVDTDMSIETDM